jgi:hypothetical protein
VPASSTAPATTSTKDAILSGPAGSANSTMPAAIGSEFVNSVAGPIVLSARPRWKPSWRQANASPCAARSAGTKNSRPPAAAFVATSPAP